MMQGALPGAVESFTVRVSLGDNESGIVRADLCIGEANWPLIVHVAGWYPNEFGDYLRGPLHSAKAESLEDAVRIATEWALSQAVRHRPDAFTIRHHKHARLWSVWLDGAYRMEAFDRKYKAEAFIDAMEPWASALRTLNQTPPPGGEERAKLVCATNDAFLAATRKAEEAERS